MIRGTWHVALYVVGRRPLESPGIVAIPRGERTAVGVAVWGYTTAIAPMRSSSMPTMSATCYSYTCWTRVMKPRSGPVTIEPTSSDSALSFPSRPCGR